MAVNIHDFLFALSQDLRKRLTRHDDRKWISQLTKPKRRNGRKTRNQTAKHGETSTHDAGAELERFPRSKSQVLSLGPVQCEVRQVCHQHIWEQQPIAERAMLLDAPCVKTQPIPIKDMLSFFLHEDAAVLYVLCVSRPGKSWPPLAFHLHLQCNKVSKAKYMSLLWFCHISEESIRSI